MEDAQKDAKIAMAAPLPQTTIGYPVTPLKFWLMSILTCSLYNVYWAFHNFRRLDTKSSAKGLAAASALFLPLCFNELLKALRKTANEAGVPIQIHNLALSWTFFILTISSRLSDRTNHPLIGLCLAVAADSILFIAVQKVIQINAIAHPDAKPDGKFTAWDIVGMVLGGLVLILNIIAIIEGVN